VAACEDTPCLMCIINHAYRFVFIHIPKTAGTSVVSYLAALTTYRDQEIGATAFGEAVAPAYGDRFGLRKHSTLQEIAHCMGQRELGDYLTFSVVRDPLDRLQSTFHFMRRWRQWREMPAWADRVEEFDACRDLDDFVHSSLFGSPGPDRWLQPQTDWLSVIGPGGPLDIGMLARVESLADGLAAFVARVGAERALAGRSIPRLNESPRPQGARDLSASAMGRVRQRYARDFELLGY
jgi:hypothetical protein